MSNAISYEKILLFQNILFRKKYAKILVLILELSMQKNRKKYFAILF
jgi:hypothetical protein